MAKKRVTITKLKKDLWKVYALHMKQRYAIGDKVRCFTCDRVMQIGTSGCQLGHWLTKGGHPRHYFTEDNTRPQCYHCNINLSGNSEEFRRRLIAELGEERVDELYYTRFEPWKPDREWYAEQIHKYKQLIK